MSELRQLLIVALLIQVTQSSPARTQAGTDSIAVGFVDVAAQVGVDALSTSGKELRYIVEGSIGGSAFFDYDNDGDVDL